MTSDVKTVDTILSDPVKKRTRKPREAKQDPHEMFLCEVSEHRMTILKDEGLYRHVKFARPDSSMYRFDLVTWPGHLVICGDLQDYHFTREPDMFGFFRNNPDRPHLTINPDYWAQKLTGHRQQSETYSFEAFKSSLVQDFLWNRESILEGHRRQVWRAIREEILDDPDVQHSREEAYRAASEFRYFHRDSATRETVEFEFCDVFEWRFTDWDWHFLISLHAIVWGIRQYDTRERHSEAYWLREDLREARKARRAAVKNNEELKAKVKTLEGEYQDLRNDVLRGV